MSAIGRNRVLRAACVAGAMAMTAAVPSAGQGQPGEITLPTLGLKIADRKFPVDSRSRPPVLEMLSVVGAATSWQMLYRTSGKRSETIDFSHVVVRPASDGRWRSEIPTNGQSNPDARPLFPDRGFLPGVTEASTAANAAFNANRAARMRQVMASPCGYDRARSTALADSMQEVAWAANVPTDRVVSFFFENAQTQCRYDTNALPPFEASLMAMADKRRLDPCAFDPRVDHTRLFTAPPYNANNTREHYKEYGLSDVRGLLARADSTVRACVFRVIKNDLLRATELPKP